MGVPRLIGMWFGIWALIAMTAVSGGLLGHARAEDDSGSGDDETEPAARSAAAGMFLPWTEAPRTDTQGGYGTTYVGYDSASKSAAIEGRAELTLLSPVALRVGVMQDHASGRLRPSFGARVQALSQLDGQLLDGSIGLFYKPEGFTEGEGEIEAVLAIGRRFDRLGLFANLVYGQDPEARERDGEARFSALYSITPLFQLGFDSRLRLDLGTEADKLEEEGGAEYDVLLGPAANYNFGTFSLGAVGGVSVLGTKQVQVGPVVLMSLSMAL